MKTRKIVLLGIFAALLVICIVQGILDARNPVKTLTITDSPDFISIENSSNKIELSLDGTTWYVGHNNFQAEKSSIENIVKTIKEIKVLDTLGRLGNDDFNARYDLNDEKAYVVTAKKGDKVIRTMRIGKASSTGSQSYVQADKSNAIYLVSGNLNAVFNKTEDSLKSKNIFSLAPSSVQSVSVTMGNKNYSIERNVPNQISNDDQNITQESWIFKSQSMAEIALDSSKVDSWLNQITTCSATNWLEDSTILPSKKTSSVEITLSNGEKTTLDVFEQKDGDSTKYICTSNKTTHKFELSESACAKYKKDSNELKK